MDGTQELFLRYRFIPSRKTSRKCSASINAFFSLDISVSFERIAERSSSYKRSRSLLLPRSFFETRLRVVPARAASKGTRSLRRFNFHLFARHERLQTRSGTRQVA